MKKPITLFTALALLIGLCACKSTTDRWQEQYDLGIQYLSEGNYQEAILAFTAAIEIEENHAATYFGRGQAYYGLVSLVEQNEAIDLESFPVDGTQEDQLRYCYEQAIRDYERAIELEPDVAEYYDEIMKIALEYGDIERMIRYGEQKYQHVEDNGLRDLYETACTSFSLMEQLAELFLAGSDDEIFALMQGSSYEALLSLQEYLERPILREYDGKTLGVYRVDDDTYGHCMIYFGDCPDGTRSGSGAWYGYYEGNNYASRGDWRDDAPNGLFETKEWYSRLAEEVSYRLVSGQVSNGLWNGAVLWAFDSAEGYLSWNCSFADGSAVVVKTVDDEEGITYCWSEQSNEGAGILGSDQNPADYQEGIAGFTPNRQSLKRGGA